METQYCISANGELTEAVYGTLAAAMADLRCLCDYDFQRARDAAWASGQSTPTVIWGERSYSIDGRKVSVIRR